MGILATIGGLFSGPVEANKIGDAVINSVDMLVLTEEERIQYRQKAVDFKMQFMAATTGSRRVRRILATALIGTFLFMLVGMCIIFGIEYYWLGNPMQMIDTPNITGTVPKSTPWADFIGHHLAVQVANPVNIIIVFYFTMDIASNWKRQ